MPLPNWIKITVPALATVGMLYAVIDSISERKVHLESKPIQIRQVEDDSIERRIRRNPEFITFIQPIVCWGDELPPRIKKHYDEYTKNGLMRKKMAQAEKKYGEYLDLYSEGYNIPRDLLLATIMVESGGNRKLTSTAGAKGLLQLMPDTAKDMEKISGLSCDDLYDAQISLTCGSFYLSWIHGKMDRTFPDLGINEKWDLILAGYNRGHNGITKEMKKVRAESFLGLSEGDTTLQAYEYVSKVRAVERILQEDRRKVFDLVNFKSWPYSEFR
ncbi:transglycosylase SLT domain-containing protein [Candidatus Woesearchaeota archaeon]|nr:transglycosylase SLT domain-containing protein [Candidatus Woesearchaeota archaeon]